MAHFIFVIPAKEEDLLRSEINEEYTVRNVSLQKDIPNELKNCRSSLREEGAEFILDAFDTYFSVLRHGDKLPMDLIFVAYEDLHKGAVELNKALGFLLEDKDNINDEVRAKYCNIIKMLVYMYTQTVLYIENRHNAKREQMITVSKGRKKSSKDSQEEYDIDKKRVLLALNNILQRDISMFWESQVVEESFINLISGICYEFLKNPDVKKEKDDFTEIFNVIGYLMKVYNHGTTFIVRITQLIKIHEHLVHCVPKGIQHLVQTFNFKGLLHDLIEELTEWQTDDSHPDPQGSRHCSTVLSSLAALLPDLMMPEVLSLDVYLFHEPASLRCSVLTVMTEVILNNLTSNDLNDEQKKFRDSLLDILLQHTDDVSVVVRSKVFNQFGRLQREMAIPLKYQLKILEAAVEHLCDKGALSRKCAANCVTTFLSCNAFSSNLSLSSLRAELKSHMEKVDKAKEKLKDPNMDKLMELQSHWNQIVEPLKAEVEKDIEKGKENKEQLEQNQLPLEQVPEVIRLYLENEQYKEAIQVVRKALKDNKFLEKFKERSSMDDLDFLMFVFYTTFFEVPKIVGQINNDEFAKFTEEDYKQYDSLLTQADYLKQCVEFLEAINAAIDMMVELLETTSVSDMHEAIAFFVAAYQFNIDRASDGILAMLHLMQRMEQERKDAVVAAFKNIYLFSETDNLTDHVATVVNRLLRLVRTLPVININDIQEIIKDWVVKGTLDNSCIDMLWQIITKRINASEEDEIAAAVLLRMAAEGRQTIISRNINLMTSIAFSERGKKNPQFLGVCCELLSVAHEKVDINSHTPPFKIKLDEQCFTDLAAILIELFFQPVEFYQKALFGGLDFVYKLCSAPEQFAEQLFHAIGPQLKQKQNDDQDVPHYVLIRMCQMYGYVALKQLEYLDDTVYKELKRRQTIRDDRKKSKSPKKPAKKGNKRKSVTATEASALNNTMMEESTLEGAQAEDMDAEFILNILEKDIVTGSGALALAAPLIIKICERQDLYDTVQLQFAGVTALSRYMLVSSEFCKKHIRLLFTIFEKTKYPDIKTNILIHVSDLLTRFPNIIEPWSDRLFLSLKDSLPQTRRTTFFTLSSLILRDMIRAHSHISKMAACLADEDETLRSMAKTFFLKLSHKENNLYNALPDIFSHFIEESISDDEDFRNTMKILFDMVEDAKHRENIVARFCSKFHLTEENRQHRHISYCLTLLKYNDKALRRLIEDFPVYKHLVHDEEIYANFRTIIQNCSKQAPGKMDLKPMATELEDLIKSVFEIRDDGAAMPPPPVPKSVKKRKPTKTVAKRKKTRIVDSDDDSD